MKQFFVARFTNGYSIEVYCLEHKDNSPCDFHLVPCGLDGKPHSIVNECEIAEEQLAPTLDYLQLQMDLVDHPEYDGGFPILRKLARNLWAFKEGGSHMIQFQLKDGVIRLEEYHSVPEGRQQWRALAGTLEYNEFVDEVLVKPFAETEELATRVPTENLSGLLHELSNCLMLHNKNMKSKHKVL